MRPDEQDLPEELREIAGRLRAERAQVDPLRLDEIKRGVIARCAARPRRWAALRTRVATVLTLLGLLGGTGGAFALGSKGAGNGYGYGASTAMYCVHKGKHVPCKPKPKPKRRCRRRGRRIVCTRRGVHGVHGHRSRRHHPVPRFTG